MLVSPSRIYHLPPFLDILNSSGAIPLAIDSLEICVKGIDNGSESILIHLFGISSEVLFSFKYRI